MCMMARRVRVGARHVCADETNLHVRECRREMCVWARHMCTCESAGKTWQSQTPRHPQWSPVPSSVNARLLVMPPHTRAYSARKENKGRIRKGGNHSRSGIAEWFFPVLVSLARPQAPERAPAPRHGRA